MALGVTTVTYVLIALGVFGTLTVDEVIGYGETAIAEAARPALGDAGFTIMAIAALLATSSSVNATLYASSGLTAMLAEAGQFPPFFGRGSRLGKNGGMLITAAHRARHLQPRRSLRDRLGRQRLLAPHLPARRRLRLPAEEGDGIRRRDRPPGDGDDRSRPRLLRRSTRCETPRRRSSRSWRHRARRYPRSRLEANPRASTGAGAVPRQLGAGEQQMCRWLAYSGSPIQLEELLLKRDRSLVDQSLHSREGATTTNGDGFGVGWYDEGETPRVFRSTHPAWNDRNLRELAAGISFSALLRAHPRLDGDGDPGDEHAPVPARALALDAQRAHPRVPAHASRASPSPSTTRCSARSRARRTRRRCSTSRSRSGSRTTP